MRSVISRYSHQCWTGQKVWARQKVSPGSPPKANPGILIAEGDKTSEKTANRAMFHLSQGVRHRAEGCVGFLNRTQIGKGIPTRSFCQKNQRTVQTKQKPVKVGGRTTYRTLSPESTPLQNGIDE
jgi:hypothetical protein